jgi:hypothetical protein
LPGVQEGAVVAKARWLRKRAFTMKEQAQIDAE